MEANTGPAPNKGCLPVGRAVGRSVDYKFVGDWSVSVLTYLSIGEWYDHMSPEATASQHNLCYQT